MEIQQSLDDISSRLEEIETLVFSKLEKLESMLIQALNRSQEMEESIHIVETEDSKGIPREQTKAKIEKLFRITGKELQVLISQHADVHDYLLRYPDMIDILLPVCETTRGRFGMQAQLSLEVYRDLEIEDEYLTLYVRQKEYDENIMKEIKKIRTACEEMLIGKNGWFLITTDFRTPR